MTAVQVVSRLFLFLIILLLFVVIPPQPSQAASILVNTMVDEDTSNSDCSLREAITAANTDAAYNGCSGGILFDTITFLDNYTITLDSQLPQITSNMVITGNGAANTIIQASTCNPVTLPDACTPATYGVLDVGVSVILVVNNLTIANGNTTEGGGIDNAGELSVNKTIFSSNFATNQGGGIRNASTGLLTVNHSTFSGNWANFGGGIFNTNGTIAGISNSTFSGNSAVFQGGGVNNAGSLNEITNSTFSDNSAITGAGIYNFVGRTITKISNTIIAKSLSGGNCSGPAPITSTNNLTDSAGCSWDSTNWPTTSLDPTDLGPLRPNGGHTQTHALLGTAETNPAIDAADTSTCSSLPVNGKDQRGVSRPTSCDIGAYEQILSLTVTKSEDTDDGTCDSDCSLREALSIAGGGLTITFADNFSITLDSPLPQITSEVTITGKGAANTIIQASSCNPVTLPRNCTPATYRVLDVGATAILSISDLTIANGTDTSGGGGIHNTGAIANITNCTFSGNRGPNAGGIRNIGTITSIANCAFYGNSGSYGGGIFNFGTITSIVNSTFSANFVKSYGGGIANANGGTITTIANSTFSGNSADRQDGGGGIKNFTGNTITTIANTIVANSPSGGNCSGVAPEASTNNLTDSAGCSWDLTNWPTTTLDPADLGPLSSNGGPTMTHALLGTAATNPAINTGDASTCLDPLVSGKDQRGVARPQGPGCDIGAFEYVSVFPWIIFPHATRNRVE